MTIEIRNLSITSRVVQRASAPEGEAESDPVAQPGRGTGEDWRAECRRMILELLELQRER